MLKSLKDVMYYNFYEDKTPGAMIRKINLPIYYNLYLY